MRNLLCLLMVFAAVACTQDAYEKGEGAYSEMTAQLADAHVNSDKRVLLGEKATYEPLCRECYNLVVSGEKG